LKGSNRRSFGDPHLKAHTDEGFMCVEQYQCDNDRHWLLMSVHAKRNAMRIETSSFNS